MLFIIFRCILALNVCCLAGKLYGRGSTDDKGPVLAWFNVIEAFQKIGQVHDTALSVCEKLQHFSTWFQTKDNKTSVLLYNKAVTFDSLVHCSTEYTVQMLKIISLTDSKVCSVNFVQSGWLQNRLCVLC